MTATGAAKFFITGIVLWATGELVWHFSLLYFGPQPEFVSSWSAALRLTSTASLVAAASSAFVYAGLSTLDRRRYSVTLHSRSQQARDEEELYRQVGDIFYQAKHGERRKVVGRKWTPLLSYKVHNGGKLCTIRLLRMYYNICRFNKFDV